MTITNATRKAIDFACKHYHYAKATPSCIASYNVFNGGGEWCGVIIYSMGANNHIGTPYNLKQGEVCELVRVALNGKQECTSQAVAMTLRQLKKDCPLLRMVVSYADCDQQHLGTIYQATNWVYVGEVNHDMVSAFLIHENGTIRKVHRKSIHSRIIVENGVKKHCPQTLEYVRRFIDKDAEIYRTKGKRKYLMPLDKKMRKQIQPLSKPYPKTDEDWHKIDRSKFEHGERTEPKTV